MTDTTAQTQTSRTAHRAYAINAGVAWTGVVLTVLFSALGWYADAPVEPGLYGDTPDGAAGALARVADTLSYFTIWSNIAVAVAVTLLALDPLRDTVARRVLRLSSLLMITVTAIVYQVVLAPGIDVEGWSLLTDPILHAVTPLVTVVVWAVWGPRGWITARLLPGALAVPLLWIVWMLARGAVLDDYPYGFANVVELGYATVARNLFFVLLFALALAAIFWRVDIVLRKRRSRVA
ncbi:Pr6Pr family membrane protein [Nocardioides sp.]|uniref:Pr6Pr family membrane protein n=1 Tax=Nocardioides sp. TaxID=35761 RepID=UPI002CACF5E1|nr:Pr6Pr family membrane protein [Nocardioides sp.]HXH79585.1 Pr6Pr family membrane protein [Nocardioides sp.]